ncbi:hypothetical protein QUF80_02515 [Desulfococcaceae bacterium HSG8]|nr:hypothetical protein [Desulfococcaceae bacterium HSG8]
MDENKETICLNEEQAKIERLKIYEKIITVFITVTIGTFGVAVINNSFQQRQLEQQRLENEAQFRLQEKKSESERRQAEMKYLGQYLHNALESDISKRLRFVEYFAMLTISPDLREKWDTYYKKLDSLLAEQVKLEVEKEQITDAGARREAEHRLRFLDKKLARIDESAYAPGMYEDDYAVGAPQDFSTNSDEDIIRQRRRLSLEIEFLNTLSPLENELSEEERERFERRISSIKLALMRTVWGPDWGEYKNFQLWAENGAQNPVPDKSEDPADYYRYGQEEK